MSEAGDEVEVCLTFTPVTSVVGLNELLAFNCATFEDKRASFSVPVETFDAFKLVMAAPAPARLVAVTVPVTVCEALKLLLALVTATVAGNWPRATEPPRSENCAVAPAVARPLASTVILV